MREETGGATPAENAGGGRPAPSPDRWDQEAFVAFVETQRPWLDPTLRAWACGDEEAFRDLRQEVVAALYTALRTWRGDASAGTFAWKVARNVAASRVRAERRRRERERREFLRSEAEQELWREGTDPAASFAKRTEAEIVRRALSRLSPEDRAVLTLREIEGFSFSRIAALRGGTELSVRVRAFRARRKFAAAYQEVQNERW